MSDNSTPNKSVEKKLNKDLSKTSLNNTSKKEDLHKYVKRSNWPLDNYFPDPSLAKGGGNKKSFSIYSDESLWNSIERHTQTIGVSKQEWVKHALLRFLEMEQKYFAGKNKS